MAAEPLTGDIGFVSSSCILLFLPMIKVLVMGGGLHRSNNQCFTSYYYGGQTMGGHYNTHLVLAGACSVGASFSGGFWFFTGGNDAAIDRRSLHCVNYSRVLVGGNRSNSPVTICFFLLLSLNVCTVITIGTCDWNNAITVKGEILWLWRFSTRYINLAWNYISSLFMS